MPGTNQYGVSKAKVDAIAAVLKTAYEKAWWLKAKCEDSDLLVDFESVTDKAIDSIEESVAEAQGILNRIDAED